MPVLFRTFAQAMALLVALAAIPTSGGGESPGKIDLKTRDKEKPVFVLVYGATDECNATIRSMENVAKTYDIKIETWKFDVVDEKNFKFDVLIPISVFQRIKIHQTNNAKLLYPHMVIYINGKPVTYYPQARKGESTVSIDSFLAKLQEGEFTGIEKTRELRRHINGRQSKEP